MKNHRKFDSIKYSPEIIDIIERMPTSFGRIVAFAVIVFAVFVLVFGWMVKYPDTVTGIIKISSETPPVKLVANTTGNISLLMPNIKTDVAKDDYIAIIRNSATTEDVIKVKALLSAFDPNGVDFSDVADTFPDKVSLGELNLKYYTFLSALKNISDHYRDNIFERQKISMLDAIEGMEAVRDETERTLDIILHKLDISRKWDDKLHTLNRNEVATYEYEIDRSYNDLLAIQQEEANIRKELASLSMQICDNGNRLAQLGVERHEKERQLHLDILTSYHDLCDNIRAWEQQYVLKAPFEGELEYAKFITDNQYIQAGEELFSIIPRESEMTGQVTLPSGGAGKIKAGCKATIKLDDYPYMEYGSVEGVVKTISQVPQMQQTEQNRINTYMITVDLPDKLKTNYGQELTFKPDMGGTADIIVNERRLIERLFDNLRYKTR